jgi:polyketide synthase PksN
MDHKEKLIESTEAYLCSLISEVANLTITNNDLSTPFQELGIDSFRVLQVIKKLEDVFGTLPKTLLFENFNIGDLSRYFVNQHEDILSEKFAKKGYTPPVTSVPVLTKTSVQPKEKTQKQQVTQPVKTQTQVDIMPENEPVLILEKKAYQDKELSVLVKRIFNDYKNEGSASRGTRNIAPNLFIGSEKKGYFNYSRSKNILLVYAYTGPEDYFPVIADEINKYCEANNLELTIFSAYPIDNVGKTAFTSTPFGVISRILNIKEFTLKGKSMRRLRYLVSKFEGAGNCRTEEYQCGTHKETDKAIAKLIDVWSEPRTMVNPLIHIVKDEIKTGKLSPEHRLFLTYLDDTLQNAILISKLSENENGYLMDLEFYPKSMPLGGLEFAIVNMIETLAKEGSDMLSLGGTYGCKLDISANSDPYLEKTLDFLREQKIFNDEGNLQFKNKFRPENTPVFLCRAKENSNPDNVTDVIMMIADPSKGETIDDEQQYQTIQSNPIKEPVAKVVSKQNNEVGTFEHHENTAVVIEDNERSVILSDFNYNPLTVPNSKIDFDLKTDSWAQLEIPAIDKQLKFLHSQLYQHVNINESLKAVFPFSYFALASSGRNAEQAFFKSWPKKGVVLQNLLFPTAIYHEIENGFSPKELPHDEVFQLNSEEIYKGNLNWEALVKQLEQSQQSISFVAIELANNAAGGSPVSLQHLKDVKNLLSNYSIPLVMDATRVMENARFIIEQEQEYAKKSIWEVAREILSTADAVWVSLAKDFCINKGGLIATNDEAFFNTLQEVIQDDGIGLDVIDKKLIALSFTNQNTIEKGVLQRMECVTLIHDALRKHGITIMKPAGGHCILIDVTQFSVFRPFENPIASFIAWLFLNTGIRGGAHNTGMQKNTPINNLVRLAIPVGLERKQARQIIDKLIYLFDHMENIPEIILEGNPESFGEINAKFKLKKYHNLSHNLISRAAEVSNGHVEKTPTVNTTTSSTVSAKKEPLTKQQIANNKKYQPVDIAIVGMSGRYPKAKNLDELWDNLIQGKDCVETIPDERLKQRKANKFTKKYRGGFLTDVDKFDSMFFNIPPVVAEMFDPQERLLLETAWESIEDAGYYPEILTPEGTPRNIGVFVGAVWTMYQVIGAEEKMIGNDVNPNSFLWSVANRISYCLNLSGPSLSVDTACSSSMTALYLACESIYNGECSGAIVGGVNLDLHQSKLDINKFGGALSPDGVCRTFGKGANGYVAGEGVGAIFLKPLEQAEKDGDNIHGIIKSVSINHGGRTSGYMVPDPKAQANLITTALEKADIDARSVGYVEAHGTGTELGDPIEISGLTTAFQKYSVENQTCAVGSVKTNIGHLEAAAGIVGIQKVLLQMKHKKLVPSLHSSELNEFIDFENSPFYVEQNVEDWKPKIVEGVQFPLRAGISSFGAGGANAHVIIESYERDNHWQKDDEAQAIYQIFPLSALKEDRLVDSATRLRSFIQKDLDLDASQQTSIKDIGHTLRIGRKSFEHRLVIIAATKEELIEKLTLFIERKEDEHVLYGEVQNVGTLSRLLNKSEKEGFIKLISESGDLRKLAQLWIEGILNDWQSFSNSENGRRVSLPTYPFADKRHWVEREENGTVLSVSSVAHPLIDINESTFERQIFRKTFHDKEFFIYDHLVSDIPTLPGVAYLDFARKAGELAAGRKVKSIKNIIWVNPIALNNSAPVDAWIELKPEGNQVQFEVFGKNDEGVKQLHSQGKLTYFSQQEEEVTPEYIDIKSIQERCTKVVDGKDAYPLFEKLGLGLGPSFQVLQEVFKNEDEMMGIMKIPEVCEDNFQDFLLHPSLVDGAGQTVMAAHLSDAEASGEIFVPYSFGEVEIHHPLTPTCYSYIKKVNEPGSKLSKANLIILDETGKVLVKINDSVGIPLTDIHEKPAGSPEISTKAEEKNVDGFSNLYYSHVWETSALDNSHIVTENNGHLILFDTDEALFTYIQDTSEKNSIKPVLVKPGEAYNEGQGNIFTVNPASKSDFVQLLESLQKQGIGFDKICYAWSKTPFQHEEAFLKESLDKGIYSFLYLCQSIIAQKSDTNFNIIYLFFGEKDNYQPHNEAVNGFAKSLHLEHSNVVCKTLEIQNENLVTESVSEIVLAELHPETLDDQTIRYQEQQRFVRKLENINPFGDEKSSTKPLALKEKGVYLITGGAGGLGLIFAEYLAKECKARLILSGRSQLSEDKKSKLKKIESLGAEVFYMPTDVSNLEEVNRLVVEGKKKFGTINGIIHSAGVLRDSSLRNKTLEEMQAVFAPKVYGTFYLDEVTKNEKLDFFVTFSSMAAVGGNMGQSDYSYANHFMDTFAMRRSYHQKNGERSGKSLSLDWSIWADGGMQLDAQMEMFFINSLGIRPLSIETGTGAFAKALLSEETQMVVVEGMQEKMEIAWGIREKEVAEAEVQATETSNTSSSGESNSEAASLVQENLIHIAMDFLKLEEEDVSIDKILLDIGFDSIGLASYANSINDIYGTDVTPVLFFEYPSIREITKHLANDHYEAVVKAHNLSSDTAQSTETSAKSTTVIDEVPQEAPSSFTGINKGWNPSQLDQQVNGHVTGSGISADSRFIDCPIAIVGIGGVMPKSRNMKEYWENLKNEENMISVVPRDRWIWEDYDGDPITEKNKTNSKYGGFVEDADKFDPLFFGISPREAEMMDPQQRVFLETVWSTIEDSGYKVSDLSGTKTGLFVGVAVHDYADLMNGLNVELDGYTASGNSHCILANRVSFLLNLRGPSAPIDTACSSSLIAVHRAIESIHTGSSDMAIVGGVQLMLTPAAHISFGMAGMLSSDGKCKTFDKNANGYVRGEGSGAIFLKPLAQAEADNDQIYAVIKSTAENHGGKATMLTAPNPHAQAELLVEAYEKAQIDPSTVGYLECHGTGTSLGDPIEIRAISKAFNDLYKKHNLPLPEKPHIGLSSVKTNIGHLETAAGISSLLKAVLAMKHKHIPASLHFEELNPHINLKGTPFYVVDKTTKWNPITGKDGKQQPLRAGISSFGFGGANAHIVIEEYIPPKNEPIIEYEGPYVFVLSAKNTDRLKAYAQSVLDHVENYDVELLNLTYTFQIGRDMMTERVGFTVNSIDELKEKLNDYISGDTNNENIYCGNTKRKKKNISSGQENLNGSSVNSIDELIANKNFAELLKAWVEGAEIDWNKIYGKHKPKRIHVPTYPFARESYWFEYDPNESGTKEHAALHPLLHKNTSVLKQQSYSSSFKGNEFFLNKYQAAYEKTLSHGGFLEMAYQAVKHAAFSKPDFTPLEFFDLTWVQPISVSKNNNPITIALFEEDNDFIKFDTFSSDKDQELVHFEGRVSIPENLKPQQISIDLLTKQADFVNTEPNELFRFFKEKGFNGYNYPVIKTVLQGHKQLLINLSIADDLKNMTRDYVINPAIIECAIHASGILINTSKYKDSPLFPNKLEYAKIVSPCVGDMYAWIRYSRGNRPEDKFIRLDIDLIDSNGKVCVSLKSLTFEEHSNQMEGNNQYEDFNDYLELIYDFTPNGSSNGKTDNAQSEFEKLLDGDFSGLNS